MNETLDTMKLGKFVYLKMAPACKGVLEKILINFFAAAGASKLAYVALNQLQSKLKLRD